MTVKFRAKYLLFVLKKQAFDGKQHFEKFHNYFFVNIFNFPNNLRFNSSMSINRTLYEISIMFVKFIKTKLNVIIFVHSFFSLLNFYVRIFR